MLFAWYHKNTRAMSTLYLSVKSQCVESAWNAWISNVAVYLFRSGRFHHHRKKCPLYNREQNEYKMCVVIWVKHFLQTSWRHSTAKGNATIDRNCLAGMHTFFLSDTTVLSLTPSYIRTVLVYYRIHPMQINNCIVFHLYHDIWQMNFTMGTWLNF